MVLSCAGRTEDTGAAMTKPATSTTTSRRGRRGALLSRVAGEAILTMGLLMLLFVGYQMVFLPLVTSHTQHALEQQLSQRWQRQAHAPQAAPDPWDAGTPANAAPLALLTIPRLGMHWVVVEGVTLADLRLGPGHYTGTQYPGQIGNFAVAGHRIHRVFWDLDQIVVGDPIIVRTANAVYTYVVTSTEIVSPHDLAVLAPVPDHPGQSPDRPMLTLTTCNPKWENFQRLIVHALLVNTTQSSAA